MGRVKKKGVDPLFLSYPLFFGECLLPSKLFSVGAYFVLDKTETPTPLNPLGVKGIGEAATVGSTPATANAVVDALVHLGVTAMDIPMRPERVWRAIADATATV